MTNEKELRRLLAEKSAEVKKLQQAIDTAKYQKSIKALSDEITGSDKVLELIKAMHMNTEDCRILGCFIADNIEKIYQATADAIVNKQAARAKKSEARKARGRRTTVTKSAKGVKATQAQGAMRSTAQQDTVAALVQNAIANVAQDEAESLAQGATATEVPREAAATLTPQPGNASQRIY